MSSRHLHEAAAAMLRESVAATPPPGAPVVVVAWFLLRKAEVWDAVAVVEPSLFFFAKEVATRARYQARALTGDTRTL